MNGPTVSAETADALPYAPTTITIHLEVPIDTDQLEAMCRRSGRDVPAGLRQLATLLEERAADAVMHVDGVSGSVSVESTFDAGSAGLAHTSEAPRG